LGGLNTLWGLGFGLRFTGQGDKEGHDCGHGGGEDELVTHDGIVEAWQAPVVDPFDQRVAALPTLGIGISTEFGAGDSPGALDLQRLREETPHYAGFLEVGTEVLKGFDSHTEAWLASGLPTTYHFLDINLDEPEDFDAEWLEGLKQLLDHSKPAWLCGDAGLWHFGTREPAHMLLLPPVLTDSSATELADGIVRLREETGREVLPENPPGQVFVGDLHLLDFFARVCDRADTGLLLDCAHLAIYQRTAGHALQTGLDGFPLERVVEMHVAGSRVVERGGFSWLEDEHGLDVLPETWALVNRVAAAATELRAVVLECERNPLEDCLPVYQALEAALSGTAFAARRAEQVGPS